MKRGRLIAVGVVFAAVMAIYAALVLYMQTARSESYRAAAQARVTHTLTLDAPRGNIYDRNGEPLVVSRERYAVRIDRSVCRGEDFVRAVCRLTDILEQTGDLPSDSLPVSFSQPFAFTETNYLLPGSDTCALKEELGLGVYARPEEVISALLGGGEAALAPAQRRALAGAYYEIEKRDMSSVDPYVFASGVSMEAVVRIEESGAPEGVETVVQARREYVQPGLAAHVLGRVGDISAAAYDSLKGQGYAMDDSIGVSGVESVYESWLRGQKGERIIKTDARGNLTQVWDRRQVVPGNDLYLTLDLHLQQTAEQALARRIGQISSDAAKNGGAGADAAAGAIVALDVATGDVLAMASYPSFRQSDFESRYLLLLSDGRAPLLNRAIGGAYEPGSTFKPVTAAAAVSAGTLDPAALYVCSGRYDYFSSYRPTCYQGRAHGALDLSQALMQSCNCYFFEAGRLAGADAVAQTARRYGFGAKTGVDLPGEVAGAVADPAAREADGGVWTGGDTIQAAIGQSETMATPLQLAVYAAALASDGVRYVPHVGYKVTDTEGGVLYRRRVEVADRAAIDADAARQIREGMKQVALYGAGAPYFSDFPIEVAAKTGTAEVPGGSANSVMILYAPAEDPQIAVAAVIEHGGLGHYSFPMAVDVLRAYFSPSAADDAARPAE